LAGFFRRGAAATEDLGQVCNAEAAKERLIIRV
jgi:hypothetical protein